jgi:hypothetical protein
MLATLESQTLAQRLEKLEKQSRHRVAGSVVLLVVAGLVLMGQATQQSKSVEAQQFVLRDASGKLRAKLASLDSTTAALSLYDANENVRARLVAGDSPALLLGDAGRSGPYARWRLALGVGAMGGGDTGPHLLLWDSQGTSRAELYVTEKQSGFFLYDANGKVLFKTP